MKQFAPLAARTAAVCPFSRLVALVALLLTLPGLALAQTITSFTPTSGPIGTSVAITGSGFDPTAAQNAVFFGATRATVTAASATSLTATVPLGATYQYPTVTNLATALTAYARQPFVVTLNGAVSFAPKADLATGTGTGPYSVAIGDVDGDGKADLVVANNTTGAVSVSRNTTVAGATTAAFAARVNFATGSNPRSVAIGDVDGDGKPDLAVANANSATVSVFRNTATAGALTTGSFAAKVDFTTGSSPQSVAIGDVDGDGKPDLVVANSGSATVSVLRNTTAAGGLTTGSFDARIDFTTGTTPYSVTIGDVDGDGKPDLAVANRGSNTVSVLRNTAAAGGLSAGSFDTKVDFATGTAPQSVAIGDVDGDGKPDLTAANFSSATVSVLRNAAAAGGLTTGSFDATVDYATGPNPSMVSIGDVDGDGKPDLVVTNNGSAAVSVFRNTTAAGGLTTGSFAVRVNFGTGTAPSSVAIGDLNGDGRPDLAVTNQNSNSVSVLRQLPPPPTITSFTPTSGPVGTSVTITGTNLTGTTAVTFAGASGNVVSTGYTVDASGTSITGIVVPAGATTGTLSVTTSGGTSAASSQSFAVVPVITSFTPTSGPAGTSVTITGTGLSGATSVRFNGTAQTTIESSTTTQILLLVPGGATTGPLTATTAGGTSAASSQAFTVTPPPVITSFTPTSGPTGTSVTVTGTDLGSVTSVNFNGVAQTVFTSSSATQIVLLVPGGATTGTLTVTQPGYTSAPSSQAFTVVPIISSFTPTSGPAGTRVTITGTGLTGASSVRFNGTVQATFESSSATQIVLYVPAGATTGTLTVTTAGGTSAASSQSFTVIPTPVITSFTPTSGPIGTSVTITGSGFNATAAQNIVFFGATRATVTAASTTSLTVTVPLGATYQFPTVTNLATALTAYARQPFIVTLNGDVAFDAKADFAPGTQPLSVAIGDVDGDGKPDLAVANYASSTVSVFRNTAVGGGLSAGSFATKVDFPTGLQPASVAIGDVDGDGKPDLVVANANSNTVSVFRNTATAGALTTGSFAAKVDFTTGTAPFFVAIGDVDGDSKPDLAVADLNSATVSVFRNTATAGGLTTGSFAARVSFVTGTNPCSVAIGDVDGDGKPDLAVASFGSTTVSVFRNTAAVGGLTAGSFAAKVDLTTDLRSYSVAIGDVDGDGKPDLAVANYNSNTVSVFRNTSTSGGLTTGSFAAKVDFATGPAPNAVAIGDVDGDGKPDLAVTNFNNATVSVFRNTAAAGGLTTGSFAAKADYATGANPLSVAIGDVDGDGKPDLAVANQNGPTVSVLRQVVPAPLITSFTPTSGPVGTSVTITGSGLGSASSVSFNGTAQTVFVSISGTQIVLLVPAGATTGPLTVTTPVGTSPPSSQSFTVTNPPTLTAVAPNPGGLGQSITLTGTNLGSPTALTVNGANALANILSNTGTSLVVRVPLTAAPTGTVSLSTADGTATASFAVMAPPGNALAFDGVNDYLDLPLATPVPVGNAAYTVEAWVNPNSMNLGSILGWGNYGTTNQANGLSLNTTGLINYWWGNDLQRPTASLVGRWHHVAATYDGTTRTLYLDGAVLGADVPGMHAVPDARNLRIGSNSNGSFTYLNGRLDEVRVYSVALSPAQLRADMTSTAAAVPASLVLYYNFDQGTPATASTGNNAGLTTLYDLGSNATPATLTGFALASSNTTSNYVASYAMVVPVATVSTARSTTGFTANWTAPAYGTVTSYLLDVSTNATFTAPVAGSPFPVAAPATSYVLTGLNPSSAYYYRVRALNSNLATPDQGAYSNFVSQATPLPVELSAFTATAEGHNAVRLAWATASEKNSARFEAERSLDGRTFAAIATVVAAGTSTAPRAYSLIDATLPTGTAVLYYRLRQVDKDDTFSYSPVRTVTLADKSVPSLTLSPNPARTTSLGGASAGAAVRIFDAVGRLVLTATADANGTAALVLPASMPAGVYLVHSGTHATRWKVE